MTKDLEKYKEAYARLVSMADKINRSHWVRTGNNLDQESAMFAALAIMVGMGENNNDDN